MGPLSLNILIVAAYKDKSVEGGGVGVVLMVFFPTHHILQREAICLWKESVHSEQKTTEQSIFVPRTSFPIYYAITYHLVGSVKCTGKPV